MKIFVRKAVLNEANTAKKLINVKLDQTENLLPIHICNLPTATKYALKNSALTERDRQKFQKDIYPPIWWLKSLSLLFIAD